MFGYNNNIIIIINNKIQQLIMVTIIINHFNNKLDELLVSSWKSLSINNEISSSH